jgi:DNA-binding winged helix-turn-helix (wHTH) protein/Flp pilus assembly protein TadD
VHFPPFTLDAHRFVLTREGTMVDLSPRLVQLLAHLAAHPGELVTKDELMERFWPDVTVTENTLTRAIADIRKALGDRPASPRFIQTVSRRGYRFIGELSAPQPMATQGGRPSTAGALRDGQADTDNESFREWVRGALTLEAMDAKRLPAALLAFEHAITATPDYAPAHVGLANACFLVHESTRAHNAPDRQPLHRAIEHARRACVLDPAFGEAWATLGFALTAAGEMEEARAAARRAAALEPTSWRHHFRLAMASWGEERLRSIDRTLSLLPDFAPALFVSAMVYVARHAFAVAADLAARGAAAQQREAEGSGGSFPSVGLHWLHGLLRLRAGEIGPAILSFAREMDEASDARIYGAEFRVNAQIGAGFAHLAADDAGGATEAFRSALEILPRNGRALVGLYRALSKTALGADASLLLARAEASVVELSAGGRRAEAALVAAAAQVARGNLEDACGTLQRLLDAAPPGQAGWLIPIDPALAALRRLPAFEKITARLASRAA